MCCDVNEEWTGIARRHWEVAGVAERIDLRIAPAVETLANLPPHPQIDLAFIDADKGGYHSYFEDILRRLSPDGVMIFDNVLWNGAVVGDDDGGDENAVSLRRFNDAVAADNRVEAVMLPVGDGLNFVTHRR
jgi:caffeoyl-CoA O-methyltransferase